MAMGRVATPSNGDETDFAPVAEINMTPFVDVMLVLLVIFMVTAPLMMSGVPLRLPKSAAAKLTPPAEPLVLSVDGAGRVFLGAEELRANDIPARLVALAVVDAERTVHVRADRDLPYGRVMEIVGSVSAAGFRKVTMVARGDAEKRER